MHAGSIDLTLWCWLRAIFAALPIRWAGTWAVSSLDAFGIVEAVEVSTWSSLQLAVLPCVPFLADAGVALSLHDLVACSILAPEAVAAIAHGAGCVTEFAPESKHSDRVSIGSRMGNIHIVKIHCHSCCRWGLHMVWDMSQNLPQNQFKHCPISISRSIALSRINCLFNRSIEQVTDRSSNPNNGPIGQFHASASQAISRLTKIQQLRWTPQSDSQSSQQ
jgi:hypothetical protein